MVSGRYLQETTRADERLFAGHYMRIPGLQILETTLNLAANA